MKTHELNIGIFFHRINRSAEIHVPETAVVFKVLGLPFLGQVAFLRIGQNPAQERKLYKMSVSDVACVKLTEDWLLELGFKQIEDVQTRFEYDHPAWSNGRITITYIYNSFRLWNAVEEDGFYSDGWFEFKHVHKLQNFLNSLEDA